MTVSGAQYAKLIATYIKRNFSERGLEIYREVKVGKSIIGKNRTVDILCVDRGQSRALAIECKYQGTLGTVDEKIPYALQDIEAMRMPGVVVYAGEGFSQGVLQMLRAHRLAAYCCPDAPHCRPNRHTRELDHVLAQTFNWWDVLTAAGIPFEIPRPESLMPLAKIRNDENTRLLVDDASHGRRRRRE